MPEFAPIPSPGPREVSEALSIDEAAENLENAALAAEVTKEFEGSIGMSVNQAEDEATKWLLVNGFDANGQKI